MAVKAPVSTVIDRVMGECDVCGWQVGREPTACYSPSSSPSSAADRRHDRPWQLRGICIAFLDDGHKPYIFSVLSPRHVGDVCDGDVHLFVCLFVSLSLACSLHHKPVPNGDGWLRGTVVEHWSLTGELTLFCARPAANGWRLMWLNHPL